jgi:hypothetical protein
MNSIIYILVTIQLVISVYIFVRFKITNKRMLRSRRDYYSKISMWEDMKFKFDIWESENNRMNQSINTISKFVLKNDATTTDIAIKTKLNTYNNILNSNTINEELKNHLALNDYELINMKLDGEYTRHKKNAIARITRQINKDVS